jgi:transposase
MSKTGIPEYTHEMMDDIPVLMHVMKEQMGLGKLLDEQRPRHGNWSGISEGDVLVTWLAHILSTGKHYMSHVEEWAGKRLNTLSGMLKREIRPTDVSDDRLADVVEHLSRDTIWVPYERGVTQQLIRVYELKPKQVRLDTTTASAHGQEDSILFQFGHSKDHRPDLRQLKLMAASLDPLGLIAGTAVVPGNSADDGLYIPMIEQMRETVGSSGMMYVGDAKMSALNTRAHIQSTDNTYLTPLALIGQVPEMLHGWVEAALDGQVKLNPLYDVQPQDGGKPILLGRGYGLLREQLGQDTTGAEVRWSERVLVVYSPQHAAAQEKGLQQRLTRALDELHALTPPPGRGRRQFTDETQLRAQAQSILKRQRVDGLITLTYKLEIIQKSKRAYAGQPAHTQETQRFVLTARRNTPAIRAQIQHLGWRAFVTNASRRDLPLQAAIQAYRDEFLIERNFARLKGRTLSLCPLCLKRDDHVIGLTRLLTLAARVLSVVEFQARQKLQKLKRTLTGLVPGQPKRATALPTAERLLESFDQIILTVAHVGNRILHLTVTPLSKLQQDILFLLNCPSTLYIQLVDPSGFPLRI